MAASHLLFIDYQYHLSWKPAGNQGRNPRGIVTLIELAHARDGFERPSRRDRHMSPRHHRRHAEKPVMPSRDKVTLGVEVIVDGGMNREKSLR